MKKLPFFVIALLSFFIIGATSCGDDGNSWEDYTEWREANDNWYVEQQNLKNPDGSSYYTLIKPQWYQGSGVLIHYFNDRSLTAGNLSPISTSYVKVIYKGELYNGAAFDSSYTEVDSTRTFQLGTNLIMGWRIALPDMHVGDSAEVVVPWNQAYGYSGSSGISPFSNLKFAIKLVDIPYYEIKP